MKYINQVLPSTRRHWVGDGFYVSSIFSYSTPGIEVSPFLLLDYAAPYDFPGDGQRRGVGAHPHKGFETVTIAYQGEVQHRDSSGGGGVIGAGDVQWMTAGAGLMHEEFHSEGFAKSGGTFEMVQLWVNLPAKFKDEAPHYQTIFSRDIPVVELADGAGNLRVIAGEFDGQRGPAKTYTPIELWDMTLNDGGTVMLPLEAGFNSLVLVLAGEIKIGDSVVKSGELAALNGGVGPVPVVASVAETRVLVLSGEPIDEPIAGQGPFVMNTQEELQEAFAKFRAGEFGQI